MCWLWRGGVYFTKTKYKIRSNNVLCAQFFPLELESLLQFRLEARSWWVFGLEGRREWMEMRLVEFLFVELL